MKQQLIFEKSKTGRKGYTLPKSDIPTKIDESFLPEKYTRKIAANLPEISESEVMRHFINLSSLNYHIDKGIYPLGSCTMKYNPKVNELTASLTQISQIHPLQPEQTAQGSLEIMYNLSESLKQITGFDGVSLQPSAGSQGELTGLLLFRKYHSKHSAGVNRNKILVPDSAHGTNPASASIAGYITVSVKSNENGTVDLEDLKKKVNEEVAGLMLTNPNTLGLFEKDIIKIEKMIHDVGGLLYMDGANFNALLGIVRPGDMGFDVVHINLHKTFSTPHGGGGPGSGPVAVNQKLIPFLPVPIIEKVGSEFKLNYNKPESIGKVHSFYGNFGIFVRAYTYILMNGFDGLSEISKNAIINANYLLAHLKNDFDLPYKEQPLHEFVLSGDRQKKNGVTTLNIAKRLLDYGYHAPTIYFPLIVHEALMIEPTESESKESLDNFANTLVKISDEAKSTPDLVINAPHNTPIKRLDDALASRQLNICFKD